jgi:phosphopentomutase
MKRAIILVADGFGIGSAPDAEQFADTGANTLGHIAQSFQENEGRPLDLPNLTAMGLIAAGRSVTNVEFNAADHPLSGGAFGAAAQISTGKDTPSGHWEMTGVPVLFDWGYYPETPDCFPQDFLDELKQRTKVPGFLGRCHASGTDIIAQLGEEHLESGKPICYTSGDSVFQVAAHEESFGLDNLYTFCEVARELLFDANIGRVIARPFVGKSSTDFSRTGNRRDYSVEPPDQTLLDKLLGEGKEVLSIGKISDIFAHRGISRSTKATGLEALLNTTIDHLNQDINCDTLIFTNLVNFDQDFGHRRDPLGYANALTYFDKRLADVKSAMGENDLLIITADHGCDPTWHGTNHTREYVPVLAWSHHLPVIDLGERKSFADIGQTLAEYFEIQPLNYGESFYPQLKQAVHV